MSAPAILVALAFIALFVLAHRIRVDIAERRHRRLRPPSEYGPLWPLRSRRYWAENGRYCRVCQTHRRKLQVHHRYGAGNHWAIGEEPDRALAGLCVKCHSRVHTIHRRLVRAGRDREPYQLLDNVTRRVWRAGWWRRILRRKPT